MQHSYREKTSAAIGKRACLRDDICVKGTIVVAFSLFLPPAMSVARKRAHHGVRYLGLGFRVVLFLALLALVRVVLRIHNDSLGDGSESSKEITFRVPKVAFLFLARSNLPLDFVWDTFFKVLYCSSVIFFAFLTSSGAVIG